MNEVWRSIKDYEGLYEVSNWGRVRNVRTGRMLRPHKDRYGYIQATLCKDGIMKYYLVHRLVAMTFIPNPDGRPEVNHINKNKENNRVDNLEWCDCPYNIRYSLSKKVYMYNEGGLCGLWPSTAECNRNGFKQSNVSNCCNGKLKKYRGFKWSYEPPKPLLALPFYTITNHL